MTKPGIIERGVPKDVRSTHTMPSLELGMWWKMGESEAWLEGAR